MMCTNCGVWNPAGSRQCRRCAVWIATSRPVSSTPTWKLLLGAGVFVALTTTYWVLRGEDPLRDDDVIERSIREVALEQSQGLKGSAVEVLAAYEYQGKSLIQLDPAEKLKLVSVHADFRLAGGGFDPDDVDIVADGENWGSNPQIERLTPDGKFADWEDPVFSEGDPIRLAMIWAVPEKTREVRLHYWGADLTGDVALRDRGPAFPHREERFLAYAAASGGRHLLLIECTDFPRAGRAPDWYQVVVGSELAEVTSAVEVDAQTAPIEVPVSGRPFLLTRRFVLEARQPGKAIEINEFGQRTPLPEASFTPSRALLEALDRNAERDELGSR